MTSTAFAHARNNDNGGATPERRERMAKSKPDMAPQLAGRIRVPMCACGVM